MGPPTSSGRAPILRASSMSASLSPTAQDVERSRLSACAAATAIPGFGFRSALVLANASTTPSGW